MRVTHHDYGPLWSRVGHTSIHHVIVEYIVHTTCPMYGNPTPWYAGGPATIITGAAHTFEPAPHTHHLVYLSVRTVWIT